MNVQKLYEEVVNNIYKTWEVTDKSRLYEHPGEQPSFNSPGYDYYVELNGDFVITVYRDRIGNLTDKEWEELSKYIENRLEDVEKDEDFEEIFIECVKGLVITAYQYKELLVDDISTILTDYIEDEFYRLDFEYYTNKWVMYIGYR